MMQGDKVPVRCACHTMSQFGMIWIHVQHTLCSDHIQEVCTGTDDKWANIPQVTINSLIGNMQTCRAARGKGWSHKELIG